MKDAANERDVLRKEERVDPQLGNRKLRVNRLRPLEVPIRLRYPRLYLNDAVLKPMIRQESWVFHANLFLNSLLFLALLRTSQQLGLLYLYKVAGGGWPLGNIMPASSFAYDGVHVFLTYPQCSLEREQLRDFLRNLAPECEYIVGRELHDDGNPHLHAYVHFGRRRRFTGADAFDVDGYHPNVQRPRRAADCIAYCRKDDAEALVSEGLERLSAPTTSGWAEVLELSTGRDEFLERARVRFPRDYVLGLERLLFFCEWKFGRTATEYAGRGRDEFREPVPLTDWVRTNLLEVLMYPSCLYWLLSCLGGAPVPSPAAGCANLILAM